MTEVKPGVKFHVDQSSWNEKALELAWKPPPYTAERPFQVYYASKVEAERAVWRYVQEKKPAFALNSVCPYLVFGEILHPDQPASCGGFIRALWQGGEAAVQAQNTIKSIGSAWWINAADAGLLHVAAMVLEGVKDQRLIGFAGKYDANTFTDAIRRLKPEMRDRLPERVEGLEQDISTADTALAVDCLKRFGRHGWTDLDTGIKQAGGLA